MAPLARSHGQLPALLVALASPALSSQPVAVVREDLLFKSLQLTGSTRSSRRLTANS